MAFTTERGPPYEMGIRLGHNQVRQLLKDMLVEVRKDFPVTKISGLRTTGAKWKHRGLIKSRITNQNITEASFHRNQLLVLVHSWVCVWIG